MNNFTRQYLSGIEKCWEDTYMGKTIIMMDLTTIDQRWPLILTDFQQGRLGGRLGADQKYLTKAIYRSPSRKKEPAF